MEYMEGSSLQKKIQDKFTSRTFSLDHRKKNQEKAINIKNTLSQILKAVSFLHSLKIIHRDIKPSNIFVSHESNIKLGDFGISIYDKPSDYFGTLDYASP